MLDPDILSPGQTTWAYMHQSLALCQSSSVTVPLTQLASKPQFCAPIGFQTTDLSLL